MSWITRDQKRSCRLTMMFRTLGGKGPQVPLLAGLLAISGRRSGGRSVLVAALVTVLVACNGNSVPVGSSAPAGSVASVGSSAPAGSVASPSVTEGTAGASLAPCRPTLGTKDVQPPASVAPDPSVLPVPWVDRWYGNEAIWIRLPTDGVLPAAPDPGTDTISTKFPWWRVKSQDVV